MHSYCCRLPVELWAEIATFLYFHELRAVSEKFLDPMFLSRLGLVQDKTYFWDKKTHTVPCMFSSFQTTAQHGLALLIHSIDAKPRLVHVVSPVSFDREFLSEPDPKRPVLLSRGLFDLGPIFQEPIPSFVRGGVVDVLSATGFWVPGVVEDLDDDRVLIRETRGDSLINTRWHKKNSCSLAVSGTYTKGDRETGCEPSHILDSWRCKDLPKNGNTRLWLHIDLDSGEHFLVENSTCAIKSEIN